MGCHLLALCLLFEELMQEITADCLQWPLPVEDLSCEKNAVGMFDSGWTDRGRTIFRCNQKMKETEEVEEVAE